MTVLLGMVLFVAVFTVWNRREQQRLPMMGAYRLYYEIVVDVGKKMRQQAWISR